MSEPKIIKVGNTPRIEGSRITVFDILDYLRADWHPTQIALLFRLSSRQVDAAVRYIDEHKDEVMEQYNRILERSARGNPPELQAKLDAGHERFLAMAEARRRSKSQKAHAAGNSGGQGWGPSATCRESVNEADTMNEANIIKVGRNPRIAGTRITVYTILEYLQDGWHRDEIAVFFGLSSRQVEAAIRYIEEHKEEVMVEYDKIMARIARGNPPELQAKLDAVHGSARARLEELRRSKSREAADEGHSGGQ
ncbi:MAG: DUF433 domain-containing protein [Isosphaerales bacterium]